MKKISTLFAAVLISCSIFAADARGKSMLTVQSVNKADIRVVMDGKNFQPGDNSLVIEDINSGFHDVKVYRQKKGGGIMFFGKRYDLIYSTTLNVKGRKHFIISIDRFGRVSSQETKLAKAQQDNTYDPAPWNGDYSSTQQAYGMNDNLFNRAYQSIQKEWLESTKLSATLQLVQNNSLSAAQVRQLVLLFSIEKNKLDVARQAYRNTVDKWNYNTLYNAFGNSASVTELEIYMRSVR